MAMTILNCSHAGQQLSVRGVLSSQVRGSCSAPKQDFCLCFLRPRLRKSGHSPLTRSRRRLRVRVSLSEWGTARQRREILCLPHACATADRQLTSRPFCDPFHDCVVPEEERAFGDEDDYFEGAVDYSGRESRSGPGPALRFVCTSLFSIGLLGAALAFPCTARAATHLPPLPKAAAASTVAPAPQAPKGDIQLGKDVEPPRISYTEFLSFVTRDMVNVVILRGQNKLVAVTSKPTAEYHPIGSTSWLDRLHIGQLRGPDGKWIPSDVFHVNIPTTDAEFFPILRSKGVVVAVEDQTPSFLDRIFSMSEGLMWIGIAFLVFGGADSGVGALFKNKAKLYTGSGKTGVSFEDVAGCDEAKEELLEVVEFLKNAEKYRRLGARVPKGVLVCGPAGTGKTLLAKAVAGEADVPFFSISGSEFIEVFGGLGASRVRKIFADCRKKAPCILFIDEMDSIGRMRGSGLQVRDGYNEEREQTLNQLLTEMDGFDSSKDQPIILLGATNRPEVLDPALRRPGRFDRTVVVDRPDKRGREDILKIHLKGVKLAKNIDTGEIAGSTVGFTGADLANLVNEAALLAARQGKDEVTRDQLIEAIERTTAGLSRKSLTINEVERRTVAFHECGHALMGAMAPEIMKSTITKISIVPRGSAMGYTLNQPDEDRYLLAEDEMRSFIAVALGGRSAERLIFSRLTSGAADDLQRATDYAERMVLLYGMCPKVGPRALRYYQQSYLGDESQGQTLRAGPGTAVEVDIAIDSVLRAAEYWSDSVLEKNRELLVEMAECLLKEETLQGKMLMNFLGRAEASEGLREWFRTGKDPLEASTSSHGHAESSPAHNGASRANRGGLAESHDGVTANGAAPVGDDVVNDDGGAEARRGGSPQPARGRSFDWGVRWPTRSGK